jgi:hypothetical protein
MDAATKPERKYHSPSRIAHENDMSVGMVHKLIKERVLTAVRLEGRLLRVTDESYQRFLKSASKVA